MRESEPVLHATGEPDAIIRENRVDLVGRCRDEIAQELACNPLASLLMPFDIWELQDLSLQGRVRARTRPHQRDRVLPGMALVRLAKFKGLLKHAFHRHLNETEWRYNNPAFPSQC